MFEQWRVLNWHLALERNLFGDVLGVEVLLVLRAFVWYLLSHLPTWEWPWLELLWIFCGCFESLEVIHVSWFHHELYFCLALFMLFLFQLQVVGARSWFYSELCIYYFIHWILPCQRDSAARGSWDATSWYGARAHFDHGVASAHEMVLCVHSWWLCAQDFWRATSFQHLHWIDLLLLWPLLILHLLSLIAVNSRLSERLRLWLSRLGQCWLGSDDMLLWSRRMQSLALLRYWRIRTGGIRSCSAWILHWLFDLQLDLGLLISSYLLLR